jgi:hypothetical protein
VRRRVGTVGALRLCALGDAAELPALDRRLALGGAGEGRDARFAGQRLVCVVVLVGCVLYVQAYIEATVGIL